MKKGVILDSLKNSFSCIGRRKRLAVILFILQTLFLFLLFFVFSKYFVAVSSSAANMLNYFEQQEFDQASITGKMLRQEEVLGEDPMLIYREAGNIARSLILLISYLLIVLVVFNSLNWTLTHNIAHNNKSKGFWRGLWKCSVI